MGSPTISLLIPTHDGSQWLPETLRRIPAASDGLPYEALAVDNASADDTIAICESARGTILLRNDLNIGFSQAINRAARMAQGETLIVINQDLYLQPKSLRILHEFLLLENGVVGGRLLSADGTSQPSCGPFPSLTGTLGRLILPRTWRKYYWKLPSADPMKDPIKVDWATGALMAFPRILFDAVGGFDEGFFMYYEDVDFCLRARQKGFPVHYLPAAEAVHVAPYAERDGAPERLRKEVRISQMRYFAKHRPRWESVAIRGLNRAYFAAKGWEWPPLGKGRATTE